MKTKKINKTNMKKVQLKDGVETYAEQLKALFGNDSGIAISIECLTKKVVKMTVPDTVKAGYIAAIIKKTSPMFGDEIVPLWINDTNISDYKIPANITVRMINAVFGTNCHFSQVMKGEWFTYIMFKPETVYFRNDNIGSPYGVVTVSVETLAKELLDVPGFAVCSDYKA